MWIEELIPIKTIVGFFGAIVVSAAIFITLYLNKRSTNSEEFSEEISELIGIPGRAIVLSKIYSGLIYFLLSVTFAVLFGLIYGIRWINNYSWFFGSASYILSIIAIGIMLYLVRIFCKIV